MIKKVWADHDSALKERDDFQTKLKTVTPELNDLKRIAQDNENELFSEREMTKKAEEETSMLKGIVESLSSRMAEMERRLQEAEEKAKQTESWAEVEAKGRVYQKSLAGTLTKVVAEQMYGYWVQLAEATRATIWSPTKDSDSEKDDKEEGIEEEMAALEKVSVEVAVTFETAPSSFAVPETEPAVAEG